MRLSEIIEKNQQLGLLEKNQKLIQIKLKELVYSYPSEVTQVLQKTDVGIQNDLPPVVLFAIAVKHLNKNGLLRDAIGKMILEMDGFYNAIGWIAAAGTALTAITSILSGIKQGKTDNADQIEFERQQLELERQRVEEAARRRRNGWLIFGGALITIAIAIMVIRVIKGQKVAPPQLIPTA